jgi:exonuclease SbcC
VKACEAQIALRDATIVSLLGQLPIRYHPIEDADDTLIASLRNDVSEELFEAQRLEQVRIDAVVSVSEATDTLRALDERRSEEVSSPQRSASTVLTAISSLLQQMGQAPGGQAPASNSQLDHVVAWARSVVKAADSASTSLAAAEANDQVRNDAEEVAIAALLFEHGAPSEASLSVKRDAALQAVAVDAKTFETAKADATEAAALDVTLSKLDPLVRTLDALRAALSDAKFKQFVAARKEEQLLGVGTTILRRMTGDRYGFGSGLKIVDRTAGQERSSDTLSGGEKFVASLALALALVEIAARSSGRFGALFLDEGFGALDPRWLDEALSELELQATTGRMIGVITHVREVTEYIDDVLRVTKTPSGSDVHRLNRTDLTPLIEEVLN